MLISIDGKITGEYMNTKTAEILCEEYYRINREYKADAFLCGRITMEGSFTNYKKPNLSPYKGVKVKREDKVSQLVKTLWVIKAQSVFLFWTNPKRAIGGNLYSLMFTCGTGWSE